METLYLDTHIVIWLFESKTEELSKKALQLVNDNNLYISPLIELELQYLYEVKKITENPEDILEDLKNRIDLNICWNDFTAIVSKAIRINWTRDLFDRIIVAQASIGEHKLLTRDKNILKHYKYAVW